MNRITYAWGVLRHGIPDPVLAYIPSQMASVMLYAVHLYDWKFYPELGPRKINHRWHFFLTCEQAHQEFPDVPVESVKAFKASGRYFFHKWLREIDVEPKPMKKLGDMI
jgi:hypothetical protein